MLHRLATPLDPSTVQSLVRGDRILLSGVLYTARDAAHQRFAEHGAAGEPLPIDLAGQLLYYTGPTPPKEGAVIGSAGPTTSSRMDRYTPALIATSGIAGIIGKGNRSAAVINALAAHRCVYFAATGGAGALLGRCIENARVVCYEDLGPEAVYRLEVVDFPLTVAIDTTGGNLYVDGPAAWRGRWQRTDGAQLKPTAME